MEYSYIDSRKWSEIICRPDWYLELVPELERLRKKTDQSTKTEKEKLEEEVDTFFEQHLANGTIALGKEVGNWDNERKSVEIIIIHHTSIDPGMTPIRLSAIELIRLYAPYYANPVDPNEVYIKGKPISSGHAREGKQVFWPYHWLIRTDGTAVRLLLDNEIGWQAGSWDINCKSVAICFDNNYTDSRPSEIELQTAAKIIKENYSLVLKDRIFGHREVNPKTICPSNLFLDSENEKGWKMDLLGLI